MITINIEDVKYKIPNNLDELTLRTYQDILSIDKDMKDITKNILIIKYLSGMTDKHLNSLTISQRNLINNSISQMLSMIGKSLPLKEIIDIDGRQFKFESDINRIRFDQFIDLMDFTEDEKSITKNLHFICAVLYREIKNVKKGLRGPKYELLGYENENVIENAKVFKNLTMDVFYGFFFFLSILKRIYLKRLADYSLQNLKEILKEKTLKKIILENGDG